MKIVAAFMVLLSVAAASAQVPAQVYEKLTVNKVSQLPAPVKLVPAPVKKAK